MPAMPSYMHGMFNRHLYTHKVTPISSLCECVLYEWRTITCAYYNHIWTVVYIVYRWTLTYSWQKYTYIYYRHTYCHYHTHVHTRICEHMSMCVYMCVCVCVCVCEKERERVCSYAHTHTHTHTQSSLWATMVELTFLWRSWNPYYLNTKWLLDMTTTCNTYWLRVLDCTAGSESRSRYNGQR